MCSIDDVYAVVWYDVYLAVGMMCTHLFCMGLLPVFYLICNNVLLVYIVYCLYRLCMAVSGHCVLTTLLVAALNMLYVAMAALILCRSLCYGCFNSTQEINLDCIWYLLPPIGAYLF